MCLNYAFFNIMKVESFLVSLCCIFSGQGSFYRYNKYSLNISEVFSVILKLKKAVNTSVKISSSHLQA